MSGNIPNFRQFSFYTSLQKRYHSSMRNGIEKSKTIVLVSDYSSIAALRWQSEKRIMENDALVWAKGWCVE